MQYKAHKYLAEIILFPAAINACFSAFPLADVYGFINRKKLYVAQNPEHTPSESDKNAV